MKVYTDARGAGTDLLRRWLMSAPRRVHAGDTSACTRPAAGCIAQRGWSVPAPRVLWCHNDSADVGVQVQEQHERRALAAGATALGRVVNSQ